MHLLAVFLASFKIEIAGLDFHRRLNIPAALGHRVTESQTHSPLHTVLWAGRRNHASGFSSAAELLFRSSLLAPRRKYPRHSVRSQQIKHIPQSPVGTPNRHYVDLSPGTAHGLRRTFRALSCNK